MPRIKIEHLPALDPSSPPKYFVDDGARFWDRGATRLAEWALFTLGVASPADLAFKLMYEGYSIHETAGSVSRKLRRLVKAGRAVKLGRGLYAHKLHTSMFE